MNKCQQGYLFMLVSAATFSFSSVVAKWAYGLGFNPYSFSVGTSLVALVMLALSMRRSAWRLPSGIRPLALGLYALAGAGSGLMFNLCLSYLDVSLATLVLFTYPAVVSLGAWLVFGQSPTRLQVVAIVLTLAGAGLTTGPVQGGVRMLGVLLAVATTFAHSAYMLLGEHLLAGVDPKLATALTRVANAGLCLVIAPAATAAVLRTGVSGWGFLVFGALAAALVPFLCLMEGIARIGASHAAIVSTFELPVALGLGWALMGDRLTLLQGIGALLITAALVLITVPAGPDRTAPAAG